MLHFRHINRSPIRSPEANVTRHRPEDIYFPQNLTGRRQFYNGSFPVPGYVEIAINVTTHSVEAEVVEFLEQPFTGQRSIASDLESPNITLDAFVHVERFAVGTYFNAIAGAHVFGEILNTSIRIDSPELPGALFPIRITCVESAVRCQGQIVRLTHLIAVREDRDFFRRRIDTQNIVPDVVSNEHDTRLRKTDSIAHTLPWKFHEYRTLPIRRNLTDGLLPFEINGVDIPLGIASRPLDSDGERTFGGEWSRNEQRFIGRLRV